VNCLRAIHNLIYGETRTNEEPVKGKKQKESLKDTNRKPDWLNDRFSNHDE
jgi:hypothetical protein